jgi:hypothetical protein
MKDETELTLEWDLVVLMTDWSLRKQMTLYNTKVTSDDDNNW